MIFFLLFLSISYGNESNIPSWFLKPPQHSNIYISSGIATNSYDSTVSIENAVRFACEEILKSKKIRIRGGTASSMSMYDITSASFIKEEIDNGLVENMIREVKIYDKKIADDNTYVLIGIGYDFKNPMDIDLLPSIFKDFNINNEIPNWLKNKPKRKGYLYGISTTEPYYDKSKSWIYSSKLARYRLVSDIKTNLSTLVKDYKNDGRNYIQYLSESTVDYILKESIIKERYYDRKNYRYSTLIEYKIQIND